MSISKRFLTFVFTAIIAFSFFAAGELMAQQYSGIEMPSGYFVGPPPKDPNNKKLRREWSKKYQPAINKTKDGIKKVKLVLEKGGDVKADPEARQFLEKVVFPAMTQTDAATLPSLGAKRQKFLKDFMGKDVTQPARGRMIDFTIENLQQYCIDSSLHPSARLNAVILMSQLTDRPLIPRSQAPLASGKAFVVLQKIFNGENEKQFPEYLKIAAFSGMKNQLEMNSKAGKALNANVKAPLVDAVMKILPVEVDPESDAAGYWKKRQAVQFAGVLNDAQTLPALSTILKDDVSSFELKLDAVKAVAKMTAGSKANSTVAAVCEFAAKAVGGEANNIAAAREKMILDNIQLANNDLMQSNEPVDFQPLEEDGSGRKQDLGSDNRPQAPIIELPNYQLNISRNRLRAVAIFSSQAIRAVGRQGGLDTKAITLAKNTDQELGSLLKNSNVGLVDVAVKVRRDEPTPQEKDQLRKTSYVDQMIKVCEDSAKTLKSELDRYSAE